MSLSLSLSLPPSPCALFGQVGYDKHAAMAQGGAVKATGGEAGSEVFATDPAAGVVGKDEVAKYWDFLGLSG